MPEKKKQIQPLSNFALILPLEEEQENSAGIIIPDTAKQKPQKGTVVAVGPGRQTDDRVLPVGVNVNDTVFYRKYGGTEIEFEEVKYLLIKEDDLLAVIS